MRLTPGAPHNGERSPHWGQPPAAPAAHNTLQGTYAKGTVLSTPARTTAPTACGRQNPLPAPRMGSWGRTRA